MSENNLIYCSMTECVDLIPLMNISASSVVTTSTARAHIFNVAPANSIRDSSNFTARLFKLRLGCHLRSLNGCPNLRHTAPSAAFPAVVRSGARKQPSQQAISLTNHSVSRSRSQVFITHNNKQIMSVERNSLFHFN